MEVIFYSPFIEKFVFFLGVFTVVIAMFYSSYSDIDECLNTSICPEFNKCVNKKGSYDCVCLDGYQRNDQGLCARKWSNSQVYMPIHIIVTFKINHGVHCCASIML